MVRVRQTTQRRKAPAAKVEEPVADSPADEDQTEYEVETIVDHRTDQNGTDQYYVKWVGYPATSNSWEPSENILCENLITQYKARRAASDKVAADKASKAAASKKKTPAAKPAKAPVARRLSGIVPVIKNSRATRRGKGTPSTSKAAPATNGNSQKKDAEDEVEDEDVEDILDDANLNEEVELDFAEETPADKKKGSNKEAVLNQTYIAYKPKESEKKVTRSVRSKQADARPPPRQATISRRKIVVEENEATTSSATPQSSRAKKRVTISPKKPETQYIPSPSKRKGTEQPEIDFKKVKIDSTINDSANSKSITFQGTYQNEPIVMRLEKATFEEAAAKTVFNNKGLDVEREFNNDVYSTYVLKTPNLSPVHDIRATVVFPASESVLQKYTRAETILFSESPECYTKVVKPFIDSKLNNEKDYNQWVYNILEGKSEAERVILNDPDLETGFMLVRDLKWTGDEKYLNLLAICHRRDIRSLRDLNEKHLNLLKNIQTKGTKAVKDKFKKIKGQLRTFVHYHPSFYHFHVHFQVVDASDYQATDRDNLLSTIISNIRLNKDYYKKSTLTYPLSQSSALYHDLKAAKQV